jgi:hypothetical protein
MLLPFVHQLDEEGSIQLNPPQLRSVALVDGDLGANKEKVGTNSVGLSDGFVEARESLEVGGGGAITNCAR